MAFYRGKISGFMPVKTDLSMNMTRVVTVLKCRQIISLLGLSVRAGKRMFRIFSFGDKLSVWRRDSYNCAIVLSVLLDL